MMNNVVFRKIDTALKTAGLSLRGGIEKSDQTERYFLSDGRPVMTILMVGNIGGAFWAEFAKSAEDRVNPLDRWSHSVISSAIKDFDGEVVMPNDGPPYYPFQQWAMTAEPVAPSPLKILIHPNYGLWHAYRGAIFCADKIKLPKREDCASPCVSCLDKPCLTTCPVGAITSNGYDVAACASHMKSDAGKECLTSGCKARHVCPVGREYAYENRQSRFHGQAFLDGFEKTK